MFKKKMSTTQEIYDTIIAEKESGKYPELDELNSTSSTSRWRLWVWIFSFFSKSIEELFATFITYVENVFAINQPGTLDWWISEIKKFQYGDSLEFINGIYQYETIDEEKQIIAQVALEVVGQLLNFKCVKDVAGVLTPLDASEKLAINTYIDRIKFPGTYTTVISQDADTLRLTYRIYYDALLNETDIENLITDEINNYLNNIVFNGKFVVTDLTDLLQLITGINNPVYVYGESKNIFQTDLQYTEIIDFVYSQAGYFSLNTLNIEFIPE